VNAKGFIGRAAEKPVGVTAGGKGIWGGRDLAVSKMRGAVSIVRQSGGAMKRRLFF
jgi:hypothetical protein